MFTSKIFNDLILNNQSVFKSLINVKFFSVLFYILQKLIFINMQVSWQTIWSHYIFA